MHRRLFMTLCAGLLLTACGGKKRSVDRVVSGVIIHQETPAPEVAPTLEAAPVTLTIERGILFVNGDAASSWPPSPDEMDGSRIVPVAQAVDRHLLHETQRHVIFKLDVDQGGYAWLGAVMTTLGMTGVEEVTWVTSTEAHPLSIPRTKGEDVGWMVGLKPTLVIRLRMDETRVWPEVRIDFRPLMSGKLADLESRPDAGWDPRETVDCRNFYDTDELLDACNIHVLEAPSVTLGGEGCLVPPTEVTEVTEAWRGALADALRPWLRNREHFDAALVAPPGLPLDVLQRTLEDLSQLGADRVYLGGMVAEDEQIAEPRCGVGARDMATVNLIRARALGARNHAERARRPLAYSVGPLDRILQVHMPAIGACYGNSSDAGTAGNLVVALELDGDGLASGFDVPSSSFANPALHECVLQVFRDVVYPAPPSGQQLRLRYPIAFAPR